MTTYPPSRETSELVAIYSEVVNALAMGHAGERANAMWRGHRDQIEAELSRRGFQVNADDAHEQALADPDFAAQEKLWDDALEPLASSALRDMLRHSISMRDDRPAAWTDRSFGANCIWIERLTRLLNRRAVAQTGAPSELQVWAREELARVEGTNV